jgi:hypothetical protein
VTREEQHRIRQEMRQEMRQELRQELRQEMRQGIQRQERRQDSLARGYCVSIDVHLPCTKRNAGLNPTAPILSMYTHSLQYVLAQKMRHWIRTITFSIHLPRLPTKAPLRVVEASTSHRLQTHRLRGVLWSSLQQPASSLASEQAWYRIDHRPLAPW